MSESQMKMLLKDGILYIADADKTQFGIIKSWNHMEWDRKNQYFKGAATLELLDKLAGIVRLPAGDPHTGKGNIEQYRQKLHAVQDAVNAERMNENPRPLYPYPVKKPLYAHQTRGANMALLTFGWVQPGGAG